jgi:hypothetical protein
MVIVCQMKRMATPTPVLAYAYLSGAVSGATLIAVADLFWLVAAFRPDRDPQVTQLLNDLAWITFTVPVGMVIAQMVTRALAIRLDDEPRPVFPRWVTAVTIAVLAIAAVKTRVVVRQFMDVRAAPRWLRRATDAWLAVLMAAIIGLCLLH